MLRQYGKIITPGKKGRRTSGKRFESVTYQKRSEDTFWAFGIGRVTRIKKGEEYDIVELNVGYGYTENATRKFICTDLQVRKQIYTLKITQYTMFYAYTTEERKYYLAFAFFPAYVPNAYDIKRNIPQEDKDLISNVIRDESEEEIQGEQDFLSQFER